MNANDAATSWDFIKRNYRLNDRVALVIRNRPENYTLQRLLSAQDAASPRVQRYLRYENADGSDIYISMNTLKPEAKGRTKADVAEIRHLYLDLDDDGDVRFQRIFESPVLPKPNYVMDTSPGKHQIIWQVEGLAVDQAEAMLHRMAATFGGDPAATDAARVLRLPGFHNKKFAEPVPVRGYRLSDTMHLQRHFADMPAVPPPERPATRSESTGLRRDGHPLSQSERDWAWVRDQLHAGISPNVVKQALAERRPDKHNPIAYSERTVTNALATPPR
ncbi:MAG: DNA-primase RepB domain-containing protein [Gammaproteobacteria bacterium]